MRILYIAQNSIGSTSNMRGKYIKEILKPTYFKIIDIDIPLNATSKLFRSIGWRFKFGALITNINNFILANIYEEHSFDLIWVDKGVFINSFTLSKLRTITTKLIHFTPDPAFAYHRSCLFFNSIQLYDVCITTKLYELENYRIAGAKHTLYCTQGFDPQLHKPHNKFTDKIYDIVFIGHYEKERALLIKQLLKAGFKIVVAGIDWKRFVKHNKFPNLIYLGDGIFGEDYAKIISLSYFGLGLLSSWVPELHTTRTFEIPACGTCLISPSNNEIRSFFSDDEVLFYESTEEIPNLIHSHLQDKKKLQKITDAGSLRVNQGNYEYGKIIHSLILKILH